MVDVTLERLVCALISACVVAAGCAPVRMRIEPVRPPCRDVMPADGPSVRWIAPVDEGDRQKLRSWCDAVGPIVVHEPSPAAVKRDRAVVIVSWNMAVGAGDLRRLVEGLRAEPDAGLVLLLQEAYRAKTPPSECPAGSGRAGALGLPRPPDSADILELAQRLGMHGVYAPSMRNGRDCTSEPREDRGNAILSTLPLSDLSAVELPFAQQRRVAVAAQVHDSDRRIGVVSTHFDTVRGHRRMAEAIWQTMSILGWKERVVIAGDFNSALPFDGGVREMKEHFKELECGTGPTHENGRRLDHVFIGAADEPFACRTSAERHGSDHSPLIAVLPATR